MAFLVSALEAAKRLGVTPHRLRVWRSEGYGPPYIRYRGDSLRGPTYYDPEDIDRWVAACKHTSVAAERAAIGEARHE